MTVVDLSAVSVFLDFDGTITAADTGVHLLDRLTNDDWRAVDDEYASGTIGSREALAPFGVEVLTNAVDFATGALVFPHADRCCPCSTCGTCKQAPIKDARRRGRRAVFVGDGVSDRKAALLADRLFAKVGPGGRPEQGHGLAEWCELADVAYEPFESLADVHVALLG